MHKYLVALAIKAVVAGVAGSYLIGGSAKVPLFGMSVSPAVHREQRRRRKYH